MAKIRPHIPLLALTVISSLTHFTALGWPPEVVFDETAYGRHVNAYFTGEHYFDVHPPGAKLLLAFYGALTRYDPASSTYESIGSPYAATDFVKLRWPVAVAGALLSPVIFLLALGVGMHRMGAFMAGLAIALDNALIVHSRFILTDSFLLLFGFGALACFVRGRHGMAGILSGLACSTKWTGAAFPALALAFLAHRRLWTDKSPFPIRLRTFAREASPLILLPLAIYAASYALHFALLPNPGPGDAFFPAGFRAHTMPHLIVEANAIQFASNMTMTSEHPAASRWLEWPLGRKAIPYWFSKDETRRLWLIGNPVVWYGGIISALGLLTSPRVTPARWLLFLGFWGNLLPFGLISRPMFLYHYLTALVFATLTMGWIIPWERWRWAKWVFPLFLLAGFVLMAPVTYGFAPPCQWRTLLAWLVPHLS